MTIVLQSFFNRKASVNFTWKFTHGMKRMRTLRCDVRFKGPGARANVYLYIIRCLNQPQGMRKILLL